MSKDKDDIAKVWKLVKDIDVCMFTSMDGEQIRARPMSSRTQEGSGSIYFLTDVRGHKDEEVAADAQVCLSYAKPGDGKFLAITGTARVSNDRALIKALWDKTADAWWKGPDDPGVRVITVTPRDAQFWEGPNGVVATVAMIAAAVTATPPPMGDQRKVDLP